MHIIYVIYEYLTIMLPIIRLFPLVSSVFQLLHLHWHHRLFWATIQRWISWPCQSRITMVSLFTLSLNCSHLTQCRIFAMLHIVDTPKCWIGLFAISGLWVLQTKLTLHRVHDHYLSSYPSDLPGRQGDCWILADRFKLEPQSCQLLQPYSVNCGSPILSTVAALRWAVFYRL